MSEERTSENEKTAIDLILEGDEARQRMDLDEAYRLYSLATEVNPFFAKAYYKCGMIRYLQNNLDAAEEEWQKAWKMEWQK